MIQGHYIMLLKYFLLLTTTLFFFSNIAIADSDDISFQKPPASLKQSYKPQSKRNIWHHNMFKLRRESQAIEEYIEDNDTIHVKKWALQFASHYRKIAQLVPEWEDELELEWMDKLEAAARQGDLKKTAQALKKIQSSCKGCHGDYRAQVAALYRAPNFSKVHLQINGEKTNYLNFMKLLMRDMNRIKIAAEDGQKEKSQAALTALRSGIKQLRASCDDCHKTAEAKDYYLGDKAEALLDDLELAINKGKSGHALGKLAVHACARCHGSHRISSDLQRVINKFGD